MNTDFGKVLMIDGAVWDAELDEFSYQKMMNVLPIKSHPNPRKVSLVPYCLTLQKSTNHCCHKIN